MSKGSGYTTFTANLTQIRLQKWTGGRKCALGHQNAPRRFFFGNQRSRQTNICFDILDRVHLLQSHQVARWKSAETAADIWRSSVLVTLLAIRHQQTTSRNKLTEDKLHRVWQATLGPGGESVHLKLETLKRWTYYERKKKQETLFFLLSDQKGSVPKNAN